MTYSVRALTAIIEACEDDSCKEERKTPDDRHDRICNDDVEAQERSSTNEIRKSAIDAYERSEQEKNLHSI